MKNAEKSISVQNYAMKTLTYLFAAFFVMSAGAEDLAVKADQSPYQLTVDATYTKVAIDTDCILDLNGHSLSFENYTFNSGALITNTVPVAAGGAYPKVTITRDRFGENAFANVAFGGDLEVVLNGKSTKTKRFMGTLNSHTGGTTLNGFYDTATENPFNPSEFMRFADTNSFGYGTLTLKNGSRLNFVGMGSDGPEFPWKKLVVQNDPENEMLNVLHVERRAPFAGDVEIAEGAEFLFIAKNNSPVWSGDFSSSRGTLGLCGTTTSSGLQLGSNDLSNVSVKFYPWTADGGGMMLRLGNDSLTEWTIGELSTDSSITAPNENIKVFNTGDFSTRRKTLIVGTKDTDSTFYGVIGRGGNEFLDFVKTGSGCLTLGAANLWKNNTTFRGGRIKLVAEGRLGGDESTGDIVFDGGTLEYGDGVTTDYSGRVKSSTGFISVDTGSNEVTWASNLLLANNPDAKGFVKSGDGTLTLSAFQSLLPSVAVSNGMLFAKVGANVTGRVDVAYGATLTFYGASKNLNDSTVHGSGTIRFIQEDGQTRHFRLGQNADFSDFTGTVEFVATNAQSAADGLVNGSWNNHLEGATLLISGAPASPVRVFDMERSVTVGAYQQTNANLQVQVKQNQTLTFGAKAGSTSILNGPIVNSSIKLVKNGETSSLTIGPGFSVLDGSSLTVNAGTLIANQNISGEQNYTVTIANGVKLTGSGVFGAVDLSVNDVVAPALTAETDKTTEFTLLTASSITGTSATMTALLETVNAGDTKGKWKLVKKANGDGTVTLKCVYGKNAFVIILR